MVHRELSEPPGEDELRIPAAWQKILHPRRGGVPGPAVQPEPLEYREYDDSSPAEAAQHALKAMPDANARLFRFVDTWVRDRGIAFAAAATVELGHSWTAHENQARQDTYLRMRRHLAAASEQEYAEAVRAMAGHRLDFNRRLVASYLAPIEAAWTDELLTACHLTGTWHSGAIELICIVDTPRQLTRVTTFGLVHYKTTLSEFVTLADGLGPAALPAFAGLLDGSNHVGNDTLQAAYSVIAMLPSDEAFQALATRLDRKHVSSVVVEAMNRFPRRALRLLAETANAGGAPAVTASARRLLAAHIRVRPELVDSALSEELPEKDVKLIARLAQQAVRRPEAAPDAMPPLLVSPPWTRRREKRGTPTVVAGLEPPHLSRVDWADGEREAWAAKDPHSWGTTDWRKLSHLYAETGFGGHFWEERSFFAQAPEELTRPLLAKWRPADFYWGLVDYLGPIIARYEQDALELAVFTALEASPANGGRLLQPLVDRRVARIMADWLTRLKTGRAPAASWFTRHAPAAAVLLVPDAVGEPGDVRSAAETALRFLAPLIDVRAVAAEHYGAQAEAAVAEILAFDPLELYPQRIPGPAKWLEPGQLPQILLRGRECALPDQSVPHVLTMLAISKPGEPYAGIAVLRELADPRSLADFAWALFEAWLAVDMPARSGWAFTALGWLGDDDTARRIAPLIRAWPGQGGQQRAVAGLDVLAELGTGTALLQLHQISLKVRYKGLKARAQTKITEIAQRLELSTDQLSDRLVPDFGLDTEGSLWLDYGPRRFRVGFDEQLRPFVTDESGTRRKSLPPPNAKDDAELATAARSHFSGLKKDVRTVAADVIGRLESAMVTGRSWQAAEFRELLLGHPLVRHITGRLVWLAGTTGADGTDIETAFRVAEDRTLATVDDEEYELADDAVVRLAHPLHLGAKLGTWVDVFADYEIPQPFAQLGRPVYALTEQELTENRLARFEGLTVPIGRVLGLVHRGWQRGTPMDAGVERNITRQLNENLHLVVDLDPGIIVGYVGSSGEQQTLCEVHLATDSNEYWNRGRENGPRLGELDPVIASELLGDLTQLTN